MFLLLLILQLLIPRVIAWRKHGRPEIVGGFLRPLFRIINPPFRIRGPDPERRNPLIRFAVNAK